MRYLLKVLFPQNFYNNFFVFCLIYLFIHSFIYFVMRQLLNHFVHLTHLMKVQLNDFYVSKDNSTENLVLFAFFKTDCLFCSYGHLILEVQKTVK